MAKIKDLKKNDKFVFNENIFKVVRAYISDEKPLIANNEDLHREERFHHEDLEVDLIKNITSEKPSQSNNGYNCHRVDIVEFESMREPEFKSLSKIVSEMQKKEKEKELCKN